MKLKTISMIMVLGVFVSLSAQIPHWEALDGPYNAQNMIDMGLCRYSPTDPPVIYGVCQDTCLVKSIDRGESWTILPQGHSFESGIRCVAVHPTDPNIVYKGEWGYSNEKGIMKSTDGGYFWTRINDGLPNYILPSKLGINRQNPDILLLGTDINQPGDRCLFKTTDGGNNWNFVNFPSYPYITNITDFSFDPIVPYRVCLSANQSSDPNNAYRGVWLSTNFGETWIQIGKPGTGPYSMPYPDITCIAMVDENIIYAGFWSHIYPQLFGGIEVTTDGGYTWSVCSPILANPVYDIMFEPSESSTFYVAFGVDPVNCGEMGVGIIKFTNFGTSWEYYNTGLTDKFVNVLAKDNNELYIGTAKGFWRREFIGPDYTWVEKVKGLLKGRVTHIFPHQNKIISFAYNEQVISYLVMTTDYGNNWITINTFNSSVCAAGVRPDNTQEMLRGSGPNYPYSRPLLTKSTDGGYGWNIIPYASQPYSARMFAIQYAPQSTSRVYIGLGHLDSPAPGYPIFMLRSYDAGNSFEELFDPQQYWVKGLAIEGNPDYLYLGDCDTRSWSWTKGVYKSTDAGNTWIPFNTGFPNIPINGRWGYPRINQLAIDNSSLWIYAATDDYGLWRRKADGSTIWCRIGEDVINESKVVAVVVSPAEPNIVYCATEDAIGIGHIYVSPDYGATWCETPIDWPVDGLRVVNDLAFDTVEPDKVYAGTSVGVYRTIVAKFMDVYHPDAIPACIPHITLEVRVYDHETQTPIEGAMVTLYKPSEINLTQYTNSEGYASFPNLLVPTPGTMKVYVNAENRFPYQGDVQVFEFDVVALGGHTEYSEARKLIRQVNTENLHLSFTSLPLPIFDYVNYGLSTDGGAAWTFQGVASESRNPAIGLTSIETGSQPCVAYRNEFTAGEPAVIRFARYDGTDWITTTIDSLPGNGGLEPYVSPPAMRIDANNICHITYIAGYPEVFYLVYKRFDAFNPSTETMRLDSIVPPENWQPSSPSIALQYGYPHIVYDFPAGFPFFPCEIYYKCLTESGWIETINISNSPEYQSLHPYIERTGEKIIVVWSEEETPGNAQSREIYQAERFLNQPPNTWTKWKVIETPNQTSDWPVLTANGRILVWSEEQLIDGKRNWEVLYHSETYGDGNLSNTPYTQSLYPSVDFRQSLNGIYLYSAFTEDYASEVNPWIFGIKSIKKSLQYVPIPIFTIYAGSETPSPYLVQRDGFIPYENYPVDYDSTELVYRFSGLNPDLQYRLDITAYHESSGEWREWAKIDNTVQHLIKYSAGIPKTVELPVPPATYKNDGEIIVRIKKISGDFAMCHNGNLYEFEEVDEGGGQQTAMTIPLNPDFEMKVLPNIFTHNTLIQYSIPDKQAIHLDLYDIIGRRVKTIAMGVVESGIYSYKLDSSNLTSGIYFLILEGEKETKTQKILIVR